MNSEYGTLRRRNAALGGLALLGLFAAGPATAGSLTFEEVSSAVHGSKLSDGAPGAVSFSGVTISATNVSSGPDLAVIFDSRERSTRDPDLEGPNGTNGSWSKGNLPSTTVLGRMAIIQENTDDANSDNIMDNPDDEGSRPAGSIVFEFDEFLTEIGFDLVDIEGPSEIDPDGFTAGFFQGGTSLTTVGFDDLLTRDNGTFGDVEYGDNSANRIKPITAAELGITKFDRVEFNFGGSGAVDNLMWTAFEEPPVPPTEVPEPGTLALLALGLAGIRLTARRGRT